MNCESPRVEYGILHTYTALKIDVSSKIYDVDIDMNEMANRQYTE